MKSNLDKRWWIVTSFKEIWYLSHGDKNQAAVSLWVTCANGKKCHDTMGVSVDLCVVFHTSIAYHFKKSNFIYFKTLLKAWYGWIERKSSKQNKGLLKFFNGICFKYPWNIKNVAIRRLLCCKYSLCCYFRWKGIEGGFEANVKPSGSPKICSIRLLKYEMHSQHQSWIAIFSKRWITDFISHA